jgi:hypothetical protein
MYVRLHFFKIERSAHLLLTIVYVSSLQWFHATKTTYSQHYFHRHTIFNKKLFSCRMFYEDLLLTFGKFHPILYHLRRKQLASETLCVFVSYIVTMEDVLVNVNDFSY